MEITKLKIFKNITRGENMQNKNIKSVGFLTVGVAVLYFILNILGSYALTELNLIDTVGNNAVYFSIYMLATQIIFIVLPFTFYNIIGCKITGYKDKYPYTAKVSFGEFTTWVLAGITLVLFINFLNSIELKIFQSSGVTFASTEYPVVNNKLEGFLFFFFIGIAAPVLEELTFRKLLFGTLRQFGNTFGIIFSGLMFGFWHGDFNQIAFASMTGIILSYILAKTGNIFIPITIHVFNNCYALVGYFLQMKMITMLQSLLLISLVTLIFFIGFGLFIHKCSTKEINFNAIKNSLKVQHKKTYWTFLPFFCVAIIPSIILAFIR